MSSPLDGAAGIEIFICLKESGFCLKLFSWLYFFSPVLKYFPKAGILLRLFSFFLVGWGFFGLFFFSQFEMNR